MTEEEKAHIIKRKLLFSCMVGKAYVHVLISVFEFLCSCKQVLLKYSRYFICIATELGLLLGKL